jgi:predicted ATPase
MNSKQLIIENENFYILTGGPGSGKTSILEVLKKEFQCIDEVARQIIQEQVKIDGDAVHWKDQRKFLDLMLSLSIFTYEQVNEKNKPVFFDRGIPELIGYCHLIHHPVPPYLVNAAKIYRYNKKVFITPPWQEIYQNDEERKQDWREAVETYDRIADAYSNAGYKLLEIPKAPITKRVEFILEQILNR